MDCNDLRLILVYVRINTKVFCFNKQWILQKGSRWCWFRILSRFGQHFRTLSPQTAKVHVALKWPYNTLHQAGFVSAVFMVMLQIRASTQLPLLVLEQFSRFTDWNGHWFCFFFTFSIPDPIPNTYEITHLTFIKTQWDKSCNSIYTDGKLSKIPIWQMGKPRHILVVNLPKIIQLTITGLRFKPERPDSEVCILNGCASLFLSL